MSVCSGSGVWGGGPSLCIGAQMISFRDSKTQKPCLCQLRRKENIYFCSICCCFLCIFLFVYMCSYLPESELKLYVGIKQCYNQRQTCQNLLKCFFKSYFLLHFVVIWDTLLNIYSHSIFQLCCSHITFIFLQIQTC